MKQIVAVNGLINGGFLSLKSISLTASLTVSAFLKRLRLVQSLIEKEAEKNIDAEFKEVSNILGAKWKNCENEAMKLLEEGQKQKTIMQLLEIFCHFGF
ncbi:hypothetical protein MKW98_019338 [Papaver atlanticum]|uniref:Uncharacterized protein n=1 Tax=Papaver atlanticum TaxID=357466 RepID=A0AAD4S921_9MAGN|nr:hypothetical protein MKW98_019338 [Papaver atlanticum]